MRSRTKFVNELMDISNPQVRVIREQKTCSFLEHHHDQYAVSPFSVSDTKIPDQPASTVEYNGQGTQVNQI